VQLVGREQVHCILTGWEGCALSESCSVYAISGTATVLQCLHHWAEQLLLGVGHSDIGMCSPQHALP
jgi:hypothetical protein